MAAFEPGGHWEARDCPGCVSWFSTKVTDTWIDAVSVFSHRRDRVDVTVRDRCLVEVVVQRHVEEQGVGDLAGRPRVRARRRSSTAPTAQAAQEVRRSSSQRVEV